jgi:hypothetical protein
MKKIFIIVLIVFFFSCKKEESIPPIPSTPPADGSVSNATSYSGILQLYQVFGVTDADTLAWAGFLTPHVSFSQTPVSYSQNANVATVDSIFFNSVKMTYDGSYYYEDNTFTTYNFPYVWQVYGSAIIPSFTFTNTNPLPTYTGCAALPDTAKPGKVLSFNLTGISNYTKIVCFLSDGVGGSVFKEYSNTNAVIPVTFSESETANLTSGSTIIGVWIIKDNARYFGGKSFNFTTELLISKPVYVQ